MNEQSSISGRIDNWSVVFLPITPYTPPEQILRAIHGNVTGSKYFADGASITTSPIVSVEDGQIHTHSGSVYVLGEVDPEYEKLYPNAKERLFNPEKFKGDSDETQPS